VTDATLTAVAGVLDELERQAAHFERLKMHGLARMLRGLAESVMAAATQPAEATS
jgi:hypothetical protein